MAIQIKKLDEERFEKTEDKQIVEIVFVKNLVVERNALQARIDEINGLLGDAEKQGLKIASDTSDIK